MDRATPTKERTEVRALAGARHVSRQKEHTMPWKKILAAAGIAASVAVPAATIAVSAAPAVTASAPSAHPNVYYRG